MTTATASMSSQHALQVREDGGLATLLGTRPGRSRSREALVEDRELLASVQEVLKARLPSAYLDPFAPSAERDGVVLRVLREAIGAHRETGGPLGTVPTDEATLLALFDETVGWGPAQRYLRDEQVQEVKIIGTRIQVQEAGHGFVTVPEVFASPQHVLDRAQALAALVGVTLDRRHPQETVPLGWGTRVHITIPPCTPEHEALVCIRRGRSVAWDLDDVVVYGTLDTEVVALLRLFCRAGASFLIAGATGSGKTALLEALVNSWPGTPHVVTIEDNTQEIVIRHPIWTRELVPTGTTPDGALQRDRDSAAFARVTREALRQTPGVVVVGEMRDSEAGAALSLVMSDHAVLTTIHARSCLEALERFARFASKPDAYLYADCRADALDDTCHGFDVVVHLRKLGGRRVIDAVALPDGVTEDAHGRMRPRLVPLVQLEQADDGSVCWTSQAHAVDGQLHWATGDDQTPEGLQQKLHRGRMQATIRAAGTTQSTVEEALVRAEAAIAANQVERALAAVRRGWEDRRDGRLLGVAQRALALDGALLTQMTRRAEVLERTLARQIRSKRWAEAAACYDTIMTDGVLAAACVPAGGWEEVQARIVAGRARDAQAEELRLRADVALAQGRERDAADLLRDLSFDDLSPAVALAALAVRERALAVLVKRQEVGSRALDAVRERIVGLERAAQAGEYDDDADDRKEQLV